MQLNCDGAQPSQNIVYRDGAQSGPSRLMVTDGAVWPKYGDGAQSGPNMVMVHSLAQIW